MSGPDTPDGAPTAGEGSTTAAAGTPVAVDVSRDRRARVIWVVFLAGPVIWFAHFMLVYLVVEAGCSGDGPGLAVFDPPVPTVVTLAATAVAAVACAWSAWWGFRRWRAAQADAGVPGDAELPADAGVPGDAELPAAGEHEGRSGTLAFAGALLSVLSFVSVLLVGLPALVLPAC